MAESLRIYEDQENRVPGVGLRNKKLIRPANGQRTAFGQLSTSQNSQNLRVQPSRTAKNVSISSV